MDLSELIKRVRKSNNTSQKKFAKQLGISTVHYCSIENKRKNVTIDLLERIALLTKMQLVITLIDVPKKK
jgi:transcriptional regulator with XRE-family HTH domain